MKTHASEVRIQNSTRKTGTDDLVDNNMHFYVVAIMLSIAKMGFTWMNLADSNLFNINQSIVIFLVEIIAIPLSVINPSAWFSIFMTSLSILCISTGYPTFSIASIVLMFATLYLSELRNFQLKTKKSHSVYHIDSKPLVDKEIYSAMV